MSDLPVLSTLVIVEDRHAEHALCSALATLRRRSEPMSVLTTDALLAMRLRREGIDARLTIDGLSPQTLAARDRVALDGVAAAFGADRGTGFGRYLQYTLIPAFVRAVRNVTALDDQVSDALVGRLLLVGRGPLVDAARLFASARKIPADPVAGTLWDRAVQGVARMRAGRRTRWVNTDFRAIVLEPGFLLVLFAKGFCRRLVGQTASAAGRQALIVAGDRFTADVVERLRGDGRPLVLAGATQPGRALFDGMPGLLPIETFVELTDLLRGLAALLDASAEAIALADDRTHAARFEAAGVNYWSLVRRTVSLHLVAWVPLLRQLQALAIRAARACPDARLLVSADVTAYSHVLVDTLRQFGVGSTGIQHGILGEPNGHSIVHVDTLAAWGTASEAWYRARGPQTARFVVTGNPRFDGLAARIGGNPDADRSNRVRNLAPEPDPISNSRVPFTIVICTGFLSDFSVGASDYENLLMIDAVLAWANGRDDVRVIHKMHPGEEADYYADAARGLRWDPVRLTTIRDPILYDLLDKADVLVAAYSTTVLESLVLGTPAIIFDAIVQRRLLPLDSVPGVTIAFSIDDLHRQLDARRAAGPSDRLAVRSSAALQEYISIMDGNATQRVAALVR